MKWKWKRKNSGCPIHNLEFIPIKQKFKKMYLIPQLHIKQFEEDVCQYKKLKYK